MIGIPARFLMMFVAAVGLAIGSAEAAAAPKEFGQCTLPERESTSLDGTCGKWSVVGEENPKSIIDFSYITPDEPSGTGPETPLTIVRVCVVKGHNSHEDDHLVVKSSGSRDPSSDQSWILERDKAGCRYLPLRPGMKLTVSLTKYYPDLTTRGRSASGTWAIVK